MGDALGYIISGVQIVVGAVLTYFGAGAIGIPMMISGAAGAAGTALAPRPAGRSGWQDSPTYGFDKSVNASFEGMPRMVIYGEERITPSLISATTEMNGKKSFLKLLFYCGHGGTKGIESITDVEIQDEPSANYKKITTATRLGTATQTAISGFEKTGIPYLSENKMSKGAWVTYTTRDEVDELAVILQWRGGLYHIDGAGKDQGKIESTEWRMRIQYREQGSTGDWTNVAPPNDKNDGWYASAGSGWKKMSDGGWATKQKKTSPFQMLARITFSSRKKYEIQIKGREDDTNRYRRIPHWIRTEEIQEEKRAYAGSALLALSVMAQPQLSGGMPRVTALVKGRKVYDPRTSSWAWSRNPSLIVRDFLLDSENACGDWITAADIADAASEGFRDVATACETMAAASGDHKEAKFQLDLVVDVHQPAAAWLGHMLGTFRSALVEYQGKLHLVQETTASATKTFDGRQARSASNRPILMLDDGRADITVQEIVTDERPNILKSFYRDRTDGYQRKVTDEVKDTVRLAAGDPELRNELFLAGVTRQAQATRQARWVLNKARLTPRRAEIGVGIGDLDLVPAEVISVYSDSPPYSGELFLVEAITYRADFTARIHLREYDANVYDDTTDTLPSLPAQLTYQQAVQKYRKPSLGASSVTLTEVA